MGCSWGCCAASCQWPAWLADRLTLGWGALQGFGNVGAWAAQVGAQWLALCSCCCPAVETLEKLPVRFCFMASSILSSLQIFGEMGGKVTTVSDAFGAVHNDAGLDVLAMRKHLASGQRLDSYTGGRCPGCRLQS